MISMTYRCSCGYATGILDNAQMHADDHLSNPKHRVAISGFISGRPKPLSAHKSPERIEAAARTKVYEAEILRAARDKKLVP